MIPFLTWSAIRSYAQSVIQFSLNRDSVSHFFHSYRVEMSPLLQITPPFSNATRVALLNLPTCKQKKTTVSRVCGERLSWSCMDMLTSIW